ncbi:hypothetical protein GALL_403160 [mine drainage metagenome]|uniref:Peptidase S8/S53 domain-containing protein n=1 Tax=mine drainage metagenome TaxID=410659 RepID=A0A1J5QKF1_9ZZZZ
MTLEGADAAYPLKLDSLQQRTQHRITPKLPKWLLLSAVAATDTQPERATIWVSDKYRGEFLKLFDDYLTKLRAQGTPENWETPDGNPVNRELVANISRIRIAVLHDLWQSEGDPPTAGRQWWELWLDPSEHDVASLRIFAEANDLKMLDRVLILNDRVVTWLNASWAELEILPFTNVPLAEIRRPEFIDTIEDLSVDEQSEYVEDLASRVLPAGAGAPVVCHLDTGVARTHTLLMNSLAATDLHTVIGTSGFDIGSHGTRMAGLALYGPLDDLLMGNGSVQLHHGLESVRIIPGPGEPRTDPKDYGTTTIQAVSIPETQVQRPRVFCLPISTPPDKPGQPTLWSASIDALAVGVNVARNGDELVLIGEPDPNATRLIVVAAGNVNSYVENHLDESDTSHIEDPAQSWNALTVGAYTELTAPPSDLQYAGWRALAEEGGLSPHSRTSILSGSRPWPIKPDICMEGGNVLSDGSFIVNNHPLVSLRTTSSRSDVALSSANATSAASAQAARLAALAMSSYPAFWPETIRGLLVHSAEWTPLMRAEIDSKPLKKDKQRLLRRYGWGVPTEEAVLRSSRQAVTMVSQDDFVPFEGMDYRMRRFRLHELPWPTEVLSDIGAADVILKVTLSYFIEPSASRRGWRQKYSYASHGLRFDIQNPLENQEDFIARVNREAVNDEEANVRPSNTTSNWTIGPEHRNLGSLHQDIWEGSGQDLARCNSIAVYPVGGWWKRNSRKDRMDLSIRYALIVSLKTSEQGVDLYTPIAVQLAVPVTTEVTAT